MFSSFYTFSDTTEPFLKKKIVPLKENKELYLIYSMIIV